MGPMVSEAMCLFNPANVLILLWLIKKSKRVRSGVDQSYFGWWSKRMKSVARRMAILSNKVKKLREPCFLLVGGAKASNSILKTFRYKYK